MRKVLLCIAVVLLVGGVALFAAGRGEEVAVVDPTVTLTMFTYTDLTDAVDVANWEVLLEAFHEQHPNIRFEIDHGYDEAYHTRLQAMSAAGRLPDIMFLWPDDRTGMVTASGQAKDLRPWLSGREGEFAEIAMMPQGPDGEIFELPEQVTATHVMFTNERLLGELGLDFPATHEELLAQGPIIREAGLIPIAMDNGGGWQMQSTFLSALVERAGGMEWYNRALAGDNASFEDAEFVAALDIVQQLYRNDMFSPGMNTADYGRALTDFVNERAVYFIDGGWRVNALVAELTDAQKEHVSLRTYPDIPNQRGTHGSTAMVQGTGYGMNSRLEGPAADAAWEWIWFYSGPIGSEIRQRHGAVPAYRLDLPTDADPMVVKLTSFINDTPAGWVLDSVLGQESMGLLQADLQEMMLGSRTPVQVAQRFERFVAANER